MRNRGAAAIDVLKGAAAGAAAGLFASWVMNAFGEAVTAVENARSRSGEAGRGGRQGPGGQGHRREAGGGGEAVEPATVKVAEAISEDFFSHRLTREEMEVAGPAVHYAFGTCMGAGYGALAALVPMATAGFGLPFGTAVWLLGDEVTVPLLKLSGPPSRYPTSVHGKALASHLVFGGVLEWVRRVLRSVI